jgi:cell division transport system permease protein
MLAKVRALLAYHLQAALTSFNSLYTKPLATMMTVLVIAITLVLPALFWVLSDNMHQLTIKWQHGGHISLYLKSPLSTADEAALLLRVQKTAGVGDATLKSSAEGLAELQKQEGMQDVMRDLPENPLPSVIEVTPVFDVNTPIKLEHLNAQLKAYPQVEQAKLDIQWINRLQAVLGFIDSLAQGLMILLALAVILIIGNTLRLAIHNRHEEIQVLKLVGAKDSFIIRPFLYSGVLYGLIGAIFAVLLVNIFMLSLTLVVNQLAAAYEMHYSLVGLSIRQISLLVLSAIILGWLGACLSVKKQLASIEPL